MTAREDFPALASAALSSTPVGREAVLALNLVDALMRWRVEATTVLAGWDEVWVHAGCPGPLGSSKATAVVKHLDQLRDEVDRLGREIDRP